MRASAKAGNPADQMKQFAEWYTRFVNEHGYAAWESLLAELQEEMGNRTD